MLEAKRYTFSELKEALIKESNESKPVIGKNVIKDDAKNNVKAVEDIMKQAKEYDHVSEEKRDTNPELGKDMNKTTLDAEFTNEPSQDYKDRIKAQAHGFASVNDEKNSSAKDNPSLNYDGNKKFYDEVAKTSKERADYKSDYNHSGLKAHNLPKEDTKIKTAFKESKIMKRLVFKNTVFLNEENVKKRIPEDYKTDENKFYMKDSIGNEYLVECYKDKDFNYIHTQAQLVKASPKMVNEELERIKQLTSYSTEKYLGESAKNAKTDLIHNIGIVRKNVNEEGQK